MLLATGALGLGGFGAGSVLLGMPARAESPGLVLPLVDPLSAGLPDRELFAPHEQVFGEFVGIVAPLANSVVDDDSDLFGWMADGWWRTPNDPRNSRIMEHVATLSWFLCNDRQWNPYYLDGALEQRLDAAIGYYLSLQGSSGAWPVTYQEESLATTGFGLSALLATLRNLRLEDLLPARQEEIESAAVPAAQWLMDLDRPHWSLPIRYANQIAGALAAVADAARTIPAPELAGDLDTGISLFVEHAQSPAGYFHEPLGLDQRYSIGTQFPDLALLYRDTGNPLIVAAVERFAEFLTFSLIYEPDSGGAYYFASACGRIASSARPDPLSEAGDTSGLARDFIPQVPAVGTFFVSKEEKDAARQAWTSDVRPVTPKSKGNTDPRSFLHGPLAPDNVTTSERQALLAALPYHRLETFTRHLLGTIDQNLLFVRRPGYYLGAVTGERGDLSGGPSMVRLGTGFLWHPAAGMFIHSLNDTADGHWTTLGDSGLDPAMSRLDATYYEGPTTDGDRLEPDELSGHEGTFTQQLVSAATGILTEMTFLAGGLTRRVTSAGSSQELIPLTLREEDVLTFSDGTTARRGEALSATAESVLITRNDTSLLISWGVPIPITLEPTGRKYFVGGVSEQHLLRVHHSGDLTTQVTSLESDTFAEPVHCSVTAARHSGQGSSNVTVQVTSLEQDPVDVRVVTEQASRSIDALAPGARTDQVFTSGPARAARSVVVIATTSGSESRTRVWRLNLEASGN
ncbi:hypothetical protein OCAE111667_24020 [Occultella aeris]|uniref:Heparinase II/III-like protein n=1 Tax=Occultella aeris TaxID=2761496 RepID=A0A7M4DEJ6_9MICO|nr:hypothetical protein [Occultella aeris]VZO35339.1 hypothetical protein HALOF300_00536 [Occultella aeris]